MKKNSYILFSLIAVIHLFTSCTEEPIPTNTVIDVDGNVYHTVTIGTQTWMVENLMTTHYNDGTVIPNVTDNTHWSSIDSPAYCWYNNDAPNNKNTYGAIYNWYTVNTGKLAPTGWHVPTDAEWTTLKDYVTANLGTSTSVAKALAATSAWILSTSTDAVGNDLSKNNSTGFTAFPSGMRGIDGVFNHIGDATIWWSSTENNSITTLAYDRTMSNTSNNLSIVAHNKKFGMSVRCIKD